MFPDDVMHGVTSRVTIATGGNLVFPEKKSHDTYNFFRATPFNALISPDVVFPDTSCPIMQMYEAKRPGPGYDRSETTPPSALLRE